MCIQERKKRREREMKEWRKMGIEEGKGRAGTASQCLGKWQEFCIRTHLSSHCNNLLVT